MSNPSETQAQLLALNAAECTFSNLKPPIDAGGLWVFSAFDVDVAWEQRPQLHATVAYVNGEWTVTALGLTATDDCKMITAEHRDWLASRDVDTLLRVVLPIQAIRLRFAFRDADGVRHVIGDGDLQQFARRTEARQRRRWVTPELLAEVADVYRSADRYPAKAVIEHFQVSRPTASRWIAQARSDGQL